MVHHDVKEVLQWFFAMSLNVAVVLFWLTFNFISFESSGKHDPITNYYRALVIVIVSHAIAMIISSLFLIYWSWKGDDIETLMEDIVLMDEGYLSAEEVRKIHHIEPVKYETKEEENDDLE